MKNKNDLEIGFEKNSWYFSQPLHQCRNLFSGINSDFIVSAYHCQCGFTQTYIYVNHKNNYVCSQCGHSSFFDNSKISNKHNDLLVNIDFPPVVEKHSTYYNVKLFYNHPESLDLISNKLSFTLHQVYEYQLFFNGENKATTTYLPTEYVRNLAYRALLEFAANDLSKQIRNFDMLNFNTANHINQERIVLFFLRYRKLKDAEYYKWFPFDDSLYKIIKKKTQLHNSLIFLLGKHQNKSLKKVIFERHNTQTMSNRFNSLTPYIICKVLKDPNRIQALLQDEDFTLGSISSNNFNENTSKLLAVFRFLKLYYSEEQFMIILKSIKDYRDIWDDTLDMFDNYSGAIHEYFTSTPANITMIHNEFIRCYHLSNTNTNYRLYNYDHLLKNACITHKGIEFRLPKDSTELSLWSQLLRNCLFSYCEDVYQRKTLVFGAFKNNKITYAIEIYAKQIIQMSGKNNSNISLEDHLIIEEWFETHKDIHKMKQDQLHEITV